MNCEICNADGASAVTFPVVGAHTVCGRCQAVVDGSAIGAQTGGDDLTGAARANGPKRSTAVLAAVREWVAAA